MSMLTEQVERMRRLADEMEKSTFVHEATHFIAIKVLREAADTIETLSAKVRKENGFIFPENATNGDVLKRLLYGKAIITEFIHDVNISVNNTVVGQFDREWWNSPYKRGDKE